MTPDQFTELAAICKVYRDTDLWVQLRKPDLESRRDRHEILIIFDGPESEFPSRVEKRLGEHLKNMKLEGHVDFDVNYEEG